MTICAAGRQSMFGQIKEGSVVLSDVGEIVQQCWREIPIHFPTAILDESIVMPNHFHGILFLTEEETGTIYRAPTREEFGKPVIASLPTIVRTFKAAVTRGVRTSGSLKAVSVWQRGFYEHVIHSEVELFEVRKYILNNPLLWDLDKDNPLLR